MRAIFCLLLLVAMPLGANPIVVYPDGSQYTLKDGERIYIQSGHQEVFARPDFTNGNVYFTKKESLDTLDPSASPTDGLEPGSPEWCEAYAPLLYSTGYSFDDQIYLRACTGG